MVKRTVLLPAIVFLAGIGGAAEIAEANGNGTVKESAQPAPVEKHSDFRNVSSSQDFKHWLIRLRGINVDPDEKGTPMPIGGGVSGDSNIVPELDFSYFFTKNIAAELILATTKHEMRAHGTSLGNLDLGSVWLLPPTLTLQYHFCPDQRIKPYVGAGINYTVFYNEDSGAMSSIDYDDGFGYVWQAGVDFALDDHWVLNGDVKKVYLNTDASINGGGVTADVDLDPWIIGVGLGYRF